MEGGVFNRTEEGSPLLADIDLNEFDQEMESRGAKVIRYADDIVVLARSKRVAERLLESSRRYLQESTSSFLASALERTARVYSYEPTGIVLQTRNGG